MAKRTNHPIKTLLLLGIVAGAAWAAYEFIHVRKVLKPEQRTFVATEVLDSIRKNILDAYAEDVCFLELGPVHYRPREDHYRVEFTVADECVHSAMAMCQDIASLVHDQVGDQVGVFAYNTAGNPLARYVE